MTAVSAPRPGWELLAGRGQVNQRRYEALRACLHDGASLREAAGAAGYTRAALASLVRDLRAGKLTLFAPPGVPGRKSAPRKDAARGRVIELRREGLPVYEISTRLGHGSAGSYRCNDNVLATPGGGRRCGRRSDMSNVPRPQRSRAAFSRPRRPASPWCCRYTAAVPQPPARLPQQRPRPRVRRGAGRTEPATDRSVPVAGTRSAPAAPGRERARAGQKLARGQRALRGPVQGRGRCTR